MKRSTVFLASTLGVAVLATSVVLSACGGGGGGSAAAPKATPTIQLSGTISQTGYTLAAKPSTVFFAKALSFLGYPKDAYAVAGPKVHKIIALPINGGSLSAQEMLNAQSADITLADGGKFSLSLASDKDWVLAMVDTSATTTNQFVGTVAIKAGSSDSLLSVPVTASTRTALNIGTIDNSLIANDGLSTYVVSTADFSALNGVQITAMAKSDDIFRNAKNIINNYNVATGVYYQLRPDFHWTGVYSSLTTSSDPAMAFRSMTFQLDTNSKTVTMSNICSAGVTTLEFVPPIPVSTGTATFGPSNPITNAGCTLTPLNSGWQAWGTNFFGTDVFSNGNMAYGIPADFTTIPDGAWLWKENGAVRASFDINAASPPYVAVSKTPKGFVPSFKVNVDASQKITSIDVKWYYYDEVGGTYILLAPGDLSLLKHFVGQFEIAFDVTNPFPSGTRRTCSMYFDPSLVSNVVPSNFAAADPGCAQNWYFNQPAQPNTNTGLMGFFQSGGFGYFFDFFKP